MGQTTEQVYLGGGCFWCIEAVFDNLKGVERIASGYMGGQKDDPTYREVCTGQTGHAEVVQVTYRPEIINFESLLQVFFEAHDPTTLNRQGADIGTQYRSAIFYTTPLQKTLAEEIIQLLNEQKVFDNPIVTELKEQTQFYKAEGYHQDYYAQNGSQPYCQLVIKPKVEKIRKAFSQLQKK